MIFGSTSKRPEGDYEDYEDFVRRGARVGEIAADETDVEDEAAGPDPDVMRLRMMWI